MTSRSIVHYLNPWAARREQARQRLDALRQRDGENCRRCRRAMRFDLPSGHDQAASIEQILPKANGGTMELGNLVLCHARCNPETVDHTLAVKERLQARAAERRPKRRKAA